MSGRNDPPPRRFRKKPIEVEAIQWNGAVVDSRGWPSPPPELTAFAQGRVSMMQVGSKTHGGPDEFLPCIRTREGTMRVDPGDWIIRGVEGEFYPVKPSIFDATYEPAASSEAPAKPAKGENE